MGAFWIPRIEVAAIIGEVAGYKSGLALTRSEIIEHLPMYQHYLLGDDEERLRIRSEVYEDMIAQLLYRLGNIPTPTPMLPTISLYHKYKNDPTKDVLRESVSTLFFEMFPDAERKAKQQGGPIDLTPYCLEAGRRYGASGAQMALEFADMLEVFIHSKPWSVFRREEWRDVTQLADLFRSESLETYYGRFFDQRFIDYLYRNFAKIDEINWRKFEGLTCEFFEKAGFHVEIGPGRNDDNIDARIWPRKEDSSLPPTILVQCKRQKEKIGKVVVKALYADVVAEKAKSGLIVTTSSLSEGANRICTARAYPISEAHREALRRWVKVMRSPNTGVFMGQ